MNEFTKEELELIGECVEADFYHSNWSKSMYEPLMNKIQSMIDDYCHHEWITILQAQNGENIIDKCAKCTKLRFSDE